MWIRLTWKTSLKFNIFQDRMGWSKATGVKTKLHCFVCHSSVVCNANLERQHFRYFSSHYLASPCSPVFLQNLATLAPSPEPSDWSAVSINTDLYLGTIRSSVSNLIGKFQEELKKLYGKGDGSFLLFLKRCAKYTINRLWHIKIQNVGLHVLVQFIHGTLSLF